VHDPIVAKIGDLVKLARAGGPTSVLGGTSLGHWVPGFAGTTNLAAETGTA
jgi:hypothetical protein